VRAARAAASGGSWARLGAVARVARAWHQLFVPRRTARGGVMSRVGHVPAVTLGFDHAACAAALGGVWSHAPWGGAPFCLCAKQLPPPLHFACVLSSCRIVTGDGSKGREEDSMADCTNAAIRNIFRTPGPFHPPPPMLATASFATCLPGSPSLFLGATFFLCSACAWVCTTVRARAMHCGCRGRLCYPPADEIRCCGLLFRFVDHAGLEKCEYRPDNRALYGKHLVRQTRGLGGSARKANAF
jgi:hypothetical protein